MSACAWLSDLKALVLTRHNSCLEEEYLVVRESQYRKSKILCDPRSIHIPGASINSSLMCWVVCPILGFDRSFMLLRNMRACSQPSSPVCVYLSFLIRYNWRNSNGQPSGCIGAIHEFTMEGIETFWSFFSKPSRSRSPCVAFSGQIQFALAFPIVHYKSEERRRATGF